MADKQNSRGRSAKRRPYFDCSSRALSLDGIHQSSDHVDFTTTTPSPPLVPTAPPSRSSGIFPQSHRTDLFRPPSPPLLTLQQQAQFQLRTARLALLQQVGYKHPLTARVKLNGTLRPHVCQSHKILHSTEVRLPRRRSWLPSATRRGERQRRLESTEGELVEENRRNTELVELYRRHALKEEMETRNALKEEVDRRNANLQKQIRSMGAVFDNNDCAVLGDELEEGRIFPVGVDLAV